MKSKILRRSPSLIILAAHLFGMQAALAAVPGFSEQSEAAGLVFVHAPTRDTPAQGVMSGGATVGDFNGDGWPDLFAPGGGITADSLFLNQGDGTFVDQAADWGLTDLYRSTGSASGDYDGDGDDDIFVTNLGNMDGDPSPGQHKLYRNNGDGSFTDVAVAAGVNFTWEYYDGYDSVFGDYDLDGDLDLVVSGYRIVNEFGESLGSTLFRNNGDGTFTDVTDAAGVFQNHTRTFGTLFADMNGDRWPELLVAGDFGTSRYYINNRNGTFTDSEGIFTAGANLKVHNGMGTTVGDYDRDGDLDWFITAVFPTFMAEYPFDGNGLYRNDGNHQFTEIAPSAGVQDGGWGWGAVSLDYDHDGWLDIAMTNGWPVPDPVTGAVFVNEPSYLFHNNGNSTFTETAQALGLDHTLQGRGMIQFDYDRDGDMDIVIVSNGDALKLFRNDLQGPDANWLEIVLDTGAHPGIAPGGFGTDVRIRAGGVYQTMRINGASNYLGRSELIAHFGLASATVVDEIRVRWADGFRTLMTNVPANQLLNIAAIKPFTQDPLVRGQPANLTVTGLVPGEKAHFFFSTTGTGAGTCYPQLGGLCGNLLSPTYIGVATADASGIAVRSVTAPSNPALSTLHTQAMVRRGTGGTSSLKTNVISAPLLDP